MAANTVQGGGSGAAGVINPNPPKKSELIERALSDGMSDPAAIAKWAESYGVTMTPDEVKTLIDETKTADAGGRA